MIDFKLQDKGGEEPILTLFYGDDDPAIEVTPGFDFQVDASTDTDGNTRWEDTVGTAKS